MSNHLLLSFKPGISLIENPGEDIQLNLKHNTLNLKQLSPGLLAVVRILCSDGATEENLSKLVVETDGFSALPNFYYYLERFINIGAICHTVQSDGLPLATIVPSSPNYQLQFKKVAVEKNYILSRFAYCHREKDQMILESPLSHARIVLANWQSSAIVAELVKPGNCRELYHKLPGISEETMQIFLSLLLTADMLSEVKENEGEQQEESSTLAQWEFHDLLFHTRVRTGRHNNPIGRNYRFLGKLQQLPAIKPKVSNDVIDLYKPELKEIEDNDCSFTTVLEARCSIRKFGDQPITAQQLGEFLYRSARLKTITKTDTEELSNRLYPSAGACYELEFYPVINNCKNIAPGFYHYCPQDHQLCKISGKNAYIEALLEEAIINNPQRSVPQVLIILAARFQRVTWYYESIAYAGILKNVGAVFQTMYLVATALKLAPCAIGCGNADLFAAAAGTDYHAETSVGEFILGSKLEE